MSIVGRCAIPFPFHLYVNVVPTEPKILSLEKGEKKCFNLVENVMGEEKYECIILKFVINILSNGSGNENWLCFRGVVYICIFGIARPFLFQNFEWVVLCFLLVEHYGGIDSITIVIVLVV